ncbi:MAG TPA: RecQ family ATP-dependent DNA helicase [Vicinamibacterales bacterium]|nr:RecQ family ATP-dependent DNA helicase [Vicinamibacterales bacterium]
MNIAESTASRAEQLLHAMLGPGAAFREGQLEGIVTTVDMRARTLVVQRTGWGKSLVYFIAAKILRERGLGPTFLISPLLSLMRNQVEAAECIGIRAVRLDSENATAWNEIDQQLEADAIDVLLVSPERLANQRFQTRTMPAIARGIGMLVVDEAHCISDWGHDFRPDYRRIVRIIQGLPATVPVLATTATANDRVVNDIRAQLGPELRVLRGSLTRETLHLQTIELAGQAERMAWLAEHLPDLPGSGIVYCLTTTDCERVAEWLQSKGVNAVAYHAQLGAGVDRGILEQRLLHNDVKALVASVALGMGFDKPDLGFVIHFQRPGSLIAYYQQIGRAGRAVPEAYAILLSGREDDDIQDYFIRSAFPHAGELKAVLEAVETADAVGVGDLERLVNMRRRRLDQSLKLLEVDGAIGREGSRYFRTVNPWQPDEERTARVTAARREELKAIQAFVTSRECLMQSVARSLDDHLAAPCGRCSVCRGPLLRVDVAPGLVQEAIAFLQRSHRPIEPRKRWPADRELQRTGAVPEEDRASEGRALSVWGDAGWAALVRRGKYGTGRFDDGLVRAAAEMVREHWRPQPAPEWVAAVPSRRRPSLVPEVAARLADALGLPFVDALRRVRDSEEQRTMENSARQMANVAGAFEAVTEVVRAGPVLLVDDMVDSRWTFTECAMILRRAGSGLVYPLALATTSGTGDSA